MSVIIQTRENTSMDYYFDIETISRGERPQLTDPVLTIQYQLLYSDTGKPKGDLVILKSWDSSEKDILTRFYDVFIPNPKSREETFSFVAVGAHLNFDLAVISKAWQRYGFDVSLEQVFYNHPYIDLKSTLVMMNNGNFTNAKLAKFGTKPALLSKQILTWYDNQSYADIEQYITDEAQAFIEFYMRLKKNMTYYGERLIKEKQGSLSL